MKLRQQLFSYLRRSLYCGPLFVVLVSVILAPLSVNAQSVPATPDTTRQSMNTTGWAPIPARSDSVAATFVEKPRPAWETAVLVPYWIIGIPFRIVNVAGDQAIIGMDKLGFFEPQGTHPGIRAPGDIYFMPTLSISGLEGVTLGVNATRYDFLKPGNLLYARGNRSTKQAGKYGGGALFHLGDVWHLEAGGGFESVNQARYYGLGYDSYDGDLSYYYRSTSWGGFDFNRDLSPILKMGLRTYYSRVNAKEPRFNVDQSLGRVHDGEIPTGYPGESEGWTFRLGFDRNNAEQNGRPKHGGYQSVGLSFFQGLDDKDLSYLTWHANFEKFIKLWHTDRTLAVRGFANRITPVGDSEIPFTRLISFQRPDQLRGFSSLRFYGLGSVGVTVEYRWPIWVVRGRDDVGIDAYVFTDAGQVFDHTVEIGLNNFEYTGGVGLRMVNAARDLAARFELGLSDEDVIVRLTFSQTFQYNPRSFVYGKNPTKLH